MNGFSSSIELHLPCHQNLFVNHLIPGQMYRLFAPNPLGYTRKVPVSFFEEDWNRANDRVDPDSRNLFLEMTKVNENKIRCVFLAEDGRKFFLSFSITGSCMVHKTFYERLIIERLVL